MTDEKPKLHAFASFMNLDNNITIANPWTAVEVDKLDFSSTEDYHKSIKACRFFYKHDPIGSTIINKMVDIGITSLDFKRTDLTNNEEKLIENLLPGFEDFAEDMALEFLLTGLVVPEIRYTTEGPEYFKYWGLKKF